MKKNLFCFIAMMILILCSSKNTFALETDSTTYIKTSAKSDNAEKSLIPSIRLTSKLIMNDRNYTASRDVFYDFQTSITLSGTPIYYDKNQLNIKLPFAVPEEKIKLLALKNSKFFEQKFEIEDQYLFLKTEEKTNRPYAAVILFSFPKRIYKKSYIYF